MQDRRGFSPHRQWAQHPRVGGGDMGPPAYPNDKYYDQQRDNGGGGDIDMHRYQPSKPPSGQFNGASVPPATQYPFKYPSQHPTNGGDLADEPGVDASRGTYMNDGRRRIDYVLIYEKNPGEKTTVAGKVLKKTKKQLAFEKRKSKHGHAERSTPHDRTQFYLSNLTDAGLDVELEEYNDHGRDLVVAKLHATWDALCREAELLRMKMPLKLIDTYEVQTKANCWSSFWGLRFLKQADDVPAGAGPHIFWRFDRDHLERFNIPKNRDEFFSVIQRSEIVWEIMQDCRNDPYNKERRGIESMLEDAVIDCAYPLHHGDYHIRRNTAKTAYTFRQRLHVGWASVWATFKPQPLNRIRNYFGEKVGFYFAFMQFYTHALLVPSLFGLAAFLYGMISTQTIVKPVIDDICNPKGAVGNLEMCPICQPPVCEPFKMYEEGCFRSKWQYRLDNEATLIVSVLTVLWCALFLKIWRRRQARLAFDWQTYDMYELPGQIRADYEERATEERLDPITAVKEPHVPVSKRAPWIAGSIGVTLLMLAAAGASLAGLIAARIAMYASLKKLGGSFRKKNVEAARWIVHFLMFVAMSIFEKLYHFIAEKLTYWECWKTDLQYYFSLLWKLFILSMLVDFLPIAYAAWFKGRTVRTPLNLGPLTETCEPGGCMGEVVELVAVLLGARLVIGNTIELFIPLIKGCLSRRQERRHTQLSGSSHGWPQWLKDYKLGQMELDGVSRELMEMMIQLSFVVFFVPALTLAPLLCFINNVIEIRVDALNFLASHRRKTPQRVPHFETWNVFLDIILKLGVIVNAALIAFTSEVIPRLYYKYQSRLSNGTFVGYPMFSMSRLQVGDWPQLQDMVLEAKEKLLAAAKESGAKEAVTEVARNVTKGAHRIIRAVTESASEAARAGAEAEAEAKTGGEFTGGEEEEAWVAEMTECRYFDYRDMEPPYAKNIRYWQVVSYRIAAFAVFAVGFYVIIFLINKLIKDVPRDVEKKIKRHQYIVTKYLEEQTTAQQNADSRGASRRRPTVDSHGPSAHETRPVPREVVDQARQDASQRRGGGGVGGVRQRAAAAPSDNNYYAEPNGDDISNYRQYRPGSNSNNKPGDGQQQAHVNRVFVPDDDRF